MASKGHRARVVHACECAVRSFLHSCTEERALKSNGMKSTVRKKHAHRTARIRKPKGPKVSKRGSRSFKSVNLTDHRRKGCTMQSNSELRGHEKELDDHRSKQLHVGRRHSQAWPQSETPKKECSQTTELSHS